MADEGRGSIVVRAPMDRVWDVVVDFERYPAWAGDIKAVTVEERDELDRARVVTFTVGSFGIQVSYTLRYIYDPPGSLSWELVRSKELRRLDGEYRFSDSGDGVDVEYLLVADLVIPLPGLVKRRAERTIIHHALKGLRTEAERR